jgi:uncharacterized protein YkwD
MLSLVLATWLALVNTDRARAGVPALTLDADLISTAQWRADDLAARAPVTLAHSLAGGGLVTDLLVAGGVPFHRAGENLGRCTCPVEEIEPALLASPGHRANLLEPAYTRLGLGVTEGADGRTYYVQLFAD